MFADFDRSLREMGTGDLSVGRHVKRMVQAFYGRIDAYERRLSEGDGVLKPALARNLFGTMQPGEPELAAVARYLRHEAARLRERPVTELLAGEISFGDPPMLECHPAERIVRSCFCAELRRDARSSRGSDGSKFRPALRATRH